MQSLNGKRVAVHFIGWNKHFQNADTLGQLTNTSFHLNEWLDWGRVFNILDFNAFPTGSF